MLTRYLKATNQLVKEFLAEFLGTFLLILISLSCIAQNKLFFKENSYLANVLSVQLATGFAATLAIIVVGRISGEILIVKLIIFLFNF